MESKKVSLEVPLIQTPRQSNISVVGDFDPYKCPPSFQQAYDHAKAKRVGKIPQNSYGLRICPCCENIINNQEFQLDVQTSELIQLGIGYPLFYEIYKYFILLIGILLVVSGGTFYYLITKDCVENCYQFLGVVIVNFQISAQQTVKRTTIMYALTSFVLFFSCIWIKKSINNRIYQLEKTTINPSQYSVLLQNLPEGTNNQQILEWSQEIFNEKPIEAHIIYDSNELLESYETKNSLIIEYNRQQILQKQMKNRQKQNENDTLARYSQMEANQQKENLTKEIQSQNKIIDRYNRVYRRSSQVQNNQNPDSHENLYYPWTGSCILTFNNSQTVDNILINYEHSTFGYILRNLMSIFSKDPLSLRDHKVIVCKAPQPRQLLWQNMEFSFKRDFMFQILFILVMIGLMALAFKIQFAFVDYAFNQYQQHKTGFAVMFQSFIMAFIIVCLNYLLRLVVKFLASINKPHSYTIQESRFCSYYTFLFILNASLTIYIVHEAAIKGNNQLLLYDIHIVMLTTSLTGPLYKLLHPGSILKALWKRYIVNLLPQNNPYTQTYVNRLFEGPEATNADNYQYMYRMLFISVWFASIAPLGVFITLIMMVVDYWITKYLLLRVNSQSKILSIQISKPLSFLELVPLVYVAGILPFIFKVSSTTSLQHFLNQFYTYGIVLLTLLIMVVVYLSIFYHKREFIPPMTYKQIELGFLHNYETQNPLTRVRGEINYLEKLLENDKLKQSQKEIVKNAIEAKKQVNEVVSHKIVGLNRIKHKIQRRIIDEVNKELKKEYGMDLKILNSNKKLVDQNDKKNQNQQDELLSPDNKMLKDSIVEQKQQLSFSRINHPSFSNNKI